MRNLPPASRRVVPVQRPRASSVSHASSAAVSTRVGTTASTRHEETRNDVFRRTSFEEGAAVAKVEVGVGATINLGNFESLRVDVRVTVPCLLTEVDAAYAAASEKVDQLITDEQYRWVAGSSVIRSR